MDDKKRDFDKEAAQWDENPSRVKPADDVFNSIREKMPLHAERQLMSSAI